MQLKIAKGTARCKSTCRFSLTLAMTCPDYKRNNTQQKNVKVRYHDPSISDVLTSAIREALAFLEPARFRRKSCRCCATWGSTTYNSASRPRH